ETVERGWVLGRAVADERGLDGPLEGPDCSGGTGDEVGEVGNRDGLPGAYTIGGETDEASGGDEDHAFAGPDDERLHEKQKRSEYANLADALKRQQEPMFELVQLRGNLWVF